MKDKKIQVLGIGHNTVTVLDLIEDCGFEIGELWHYNHDRVGEDYFGFEIAGCFEDLLSRPSLEGMNFALTMGNLSIRKDLYDRIVAKGGCIPALIHPESTISKRSVIGNGSQISPGCVVSGDSSVGEDTMLLDNAVVCHSTHIGNHCLISGNAMIGAYAEIGHGVHIGMSATVVSGKVSRIGDNCILGAGATLLTDMPSNSVYAGLPAREIRKLGDGGR